MPHSNEQLHSALNQISEAVMLSGIESSALLGEGVYGRCFGITFARPPYRAVVKIYKYPSVAGAEPSQLTELRKYFPTLVPEVYGYLPATELGPVVIMAHCPGQSCPRPERLPRLQRLQVQGEVVDLLLKLHEVAHPAGYGPFAGPFYPRWWDYYSQRVQSTYSAIHNSAQACSYLGSEVLALMDRALEHAEQIVSTKVGRAVLLHGDYYVSNLLFDPHTWRISGLLDPLDAEWGERELDLVNLINGHMLHFELLNRYRAAVELGPCFPMRYWFYQLWKWLSYYVRVETKCREWVLRCGRLLEKEIARCF